MHRWEREPRAARRWAGCVLGATLALIAVPARAALFCVDTAAELVQAMLDASTNGADDEIRVVAGTYLPASTPNYTTGVGQNLTLSGGWSPACASQRPDPELTVIDGGNVRRGMTINVIDATATVAVRYLTFRNGNASSGQGGGLDMGGSAGNTIHAIVENCIFEGNVAPGGGGLQLNSDLGTLRLAGCLFVGNDATTNVGGVALTANGPSGEVVNNTVTGNTISGAGNWGGLRLAGSNPVVFANNIFWGNEGVDLKFGNNDTYFIYSNDIGVQEFDEAGGADNVSVDPLFAGAGDYRLQATSTLIDAGDTVQATLPALDLAAGARQLGLGPDLGAYESEHLFSDTFESGDDAAWDVPAP